MTAAGRRSSSRADTFERVLRPLNLPSPLHVESDAAGLPVAVRRAHWPSPRRVARVQDRWRIDDLWWRERPVSRLYYQVLLDGGELLLAYHDLVAGGWFEQRPGGPSPTLIRPRSARSTSRRVRPGRSAPWPDRRRWAS